MAAFDIEAKRQQAAFRAASTTISDKARRPTDEKGKRHPHLLALGTEKENLFPGIRGPAGAEAFFLARGIHWWRSARGGDDTTVNGPTRNLASSQLACVNFLLPLEPHTEVLTAILRSLDDDVATVDDIEYRATSGAIVRSRVEFEWVGEGKSLEGTPTNSRGANVTSVDALLVGRTATGTKRAYLFEWKYSEKYEPDVSKGEGPAGDTRRSRYDGLYHAPGSPFDTKIPLDAWLYDPLYQLMRLLLLGRRMTSAVELGVADYRVVVVCPEENAAYRGRITSPELRRRFPQAATMEGAVRAALREPDRFTMVSARQLFEKAAATGHSALREWTEYHKARYGWS
jgi:hypothetical protein